jgi:hypothetical protein
MGILKKLLVSFTILNSIPAGERPNFMIFQSICQTVLCYDGRTEQFYHVANIAVELWNRDCGALIIHDDKKVGEALSWTDGHFELAGKYSNDIGWPYLYMQHRCIPVNDGEKTKMMEFLKKQNCQKKV